MHCGNCHFETSFLLFYSRIVLSFYSLEAQGRLFLWDGLVAARAAYVTAERLY